MKAIINKIKFLILSLIIVIICMPATVSAQMQSYFAGSGSGTCITTEREYNSSISLSQNIQPKKVLPSYNGNSVITLGHYYAADQQNSILPQYTVVDESANPITNPITASIFSLTTNGSTNIQTVYFYNCIITDFDVDNVTNTIYFCGRYTIGTTTVHFIATMDVFTLFNQTPSNFNAYRISLPTGVNLTKIKMFDGGETEPCLALIASDGQNISNADINYGVNDWFINFHLTNYCYEYCETDMAGLLDIAVTDHFVTVLGMKSLTEFCLYRHSKTNVQNFISYDYTTYPIYNYYLDYRYHITSLDGDNVAVGYSSIINGLEFCVIDLGNSMQDTYHQFINGSAENHSKIIDMEFDANKRTLFCLAYVGGDYIKDMIIEIRPYVQTHPYPIHTTSPANDQYRYNYLTDIALYDHNRYYVVSGRTKNTGYVYWFDAIAYNHGVSTCADFVRFSSREHFPLQQNQITYNYNPITPASPILMYPFSSQTNYNVTCY